MKMSAFNGKRTVTAEGKSEIVRQEPRSCLGRYTYLVCVFLFGSFSHGLSSSKILADHWTCSPVTTAPCSVDTIGKVMAIISISSSLAQALLVTVALMILVVLPSNTYLHGALNSPIWRHHLERLSRGEILQEKWRFTRLVMEGVSSNGFLFSSYGKGQWKVLLITP